MHMVQTFNVRDAHLAGHAETTTPMPSREMRASVVTRVNGLRNVGGCAVIAVMHDELLPITAGEQDTGVLAMNDGAIVGGVPLRVVELTGESGDVILMHCDCFHAAAPNRRTEPRMMLTGIVYPNRSKQ
jgi:hypothetical protein